VRNTLLTKGWLGKSCLQKKFLRGHSQFSLLRVLRNLGSRLSSTFHKLLTISSPKAAVVGGGLTKLYYLYIHENVSGLTGVPQRNVSLYARILYPQTFEMVWVDAWPKYSESGVYLPNNKEMHLQRMTQTTKSYATKLCLSMRTRRAWSSYELVGILVS
jgi:hypothetical protein